MINDKNDIIEIVPFKKQNNTLLSVIDNILLDLHDKNKKDIINNTCNDNFEIDLTKKYDFLNKDIKNIEDLIFVANQYNPNKSNNYPFNLKKLNDIIEPLNELKNIVGMNDVKINILNQILYFLQNLDGSDMLHTVIQGPPGVGKTYLGTILSKIYYNLGVIKGSKNKTYFNLLMVKNKNIILKL